MKINIKNRFFLVGAGLILSFIVFLFAFSNALTKHIDHFFYVQKQSVSNYFNGSNDFEFSKSINFIYPDIIDDELFNQYMASLVQKIQRLKPKAIFNIAYPQIYDSPKKIDFAYNQLRQVHSNYHPVVFDLTYESMFNNKLANKVVLALRDFDIRNDYLLNFHFRNNSDAAHFNFIPLVHSLLSSIVPPHKSNAFLSHKIIYTHSHKTDKPIKLDDQTTSLKESDIKDKIIIIGTNNKLDELQRRLSISHYNTPIGYGANALLSSQVLQQIVENIGSNTQLIKAPAWGYLIFIALLLYLILLFCKHNPNYLAVIYFSLMVFAAYTVNICMFSYFNIHLLFIYLLAPAFACFMVVIFFKISLETKQQLNFQAQHEIQNTVGKIQSLFLEDLTDTLKEKNQTIRNTFTELKHPENTDHQRMIELALLSCDDFDEYLSGVEQFSKVNNLKINKKLHNMIDLNVLIPSTIALFDVSIRSKNITCKTKLAEHLMVKTDPTLLKLILQNLVSNAVKYTQKNSEIKITAIKKGKKTIIEIGDEGPGIPEQEKENIWQQFYRIKNDEVYEVKGTGLGLYLSQYFAHKLKIKLELKESDASGSVFRVII